MKTFKRLVDRSRETALQLGPYAAAAVLIPGGSVLAGLVWLYRHRKSLRVPQ